MPKRWRLDEFEILTADCPLRVSEFFRKDFVRYSEPLIDQYLSHWMKDVRTRPLLVEMDEYISPARRGGGSGETVVTGIKEALRQLNLILLRSRGAPAGKSDRAAAGAGSGAAGGARGRSGVAAVPVKEKTWIEFEVVGPEGKPAAGIRYRLKITDGSIRTGILDEAGRARVRNIDPGSCEFTLLDYDGKSWRPA